MPFLTRIHTYTNFQQHTISFNQLGIHRRSQTVPPDDYTYPTLATSFWRIRRRSHLYDIIDWLYKKSIFYLGASSSLIKSHFTRGIIKIVIGSVRVYYWHLEHHTTSSGTGKRSLLVPSKHWRGLYISFVTCSSIFYLLLLHGIRVRTGNWEYHNRSTVFDSDIWEIAGQQRRFVVGEWE